MALYGTLYGAANLCGAYARSLMPASKERALQSLIGDLDDNGVYKCQWRKHVKALLWPHSVLQLAVCHQQVFRLQSRCVELLQLIMKHG